MKGAYNQKNNLAFNLKKFFASPNLTQPTPRVSDETVMKAMMIIGREDLNLLTLKVFRSNHSYFT